MMSKDAATRRIPSFERLCETASDPDGSRKTPRTSALAAGTISETSPYTSQASPKGGHGNEEELIEDPEFYYDSFVTILVRLLILFFNMIGLLIFIPHVERLRITCSVSCQILEKESDFFRDHIHDLTVQGNEQVITLPATKASHFRLLAKTVFYP